MKAGRKILNLRCDRKISQQDLAKACGITPSALSKIEAGINSPRANIIWGIAKNLGVTVEYLLDEQIPYPYSAYGYRQELFSQQVDPKEMVKKEVTREEDMFLDALRAMHPTSREICFSMPEASVETIRLIHFLVNHAKIENPGPSFKEYFETLVTTGLPEKPEDEDVVLAGRGKKMGTQRGSKGQVSMLAFLFPSVR